MELIPPNTRIDFVGKAKYAYIFSAVVILASIVSLVARGGPRFGVDFAGGTVLQLKFSGAVSVSDIKDGLAAAELDGSTVQNFGQAAEHEFLIRTDKSVEANAEFTRKVRDSLSAATHAQAEVRRVEMVGPQVGKDLREKALLAIFYSLLFITIYISGRFESSWWRSGLMAAGLMAVVYLLHLLGVGIPLLTVAALLLSLILFWWMNLRYAVGALVALIHDVIIPVGFFSVFDKEFSLPVVAAFLTIIGYSLNDTIIVYDRIRETRRNQPKLPMPEVINLSVNRTLSRTILTGGTTLLTVLALFFLGGGIIEDFAFAMLVGVFVGTYSSVYVASPILLAQPRLGLQRR